MLDPNQILFSTPGFHRYRTDEHNNGKGEEFVSISVTGRACALNCAHCNTQLLRGMTSLPHFQGSLFDLCAGLAKRGTRGVLISGGSDRKGRVPLLPHIPDLIRVRKELDLTIRVHAGLPDEETCAALGTVGVDGAMIDIIGHPDTIREVYHLDASPEVYEQALAWLEEYHVPTVPHIVLGLQFGKMLGEDYALEMIARHPPKLLVLVVLTPTSKTEMEQVTPPPLDEIGSFFKKARQAFPTIPLMLGCARPSGPIKLAVDRLALEAGFNGIAFPANITVKNARQAGLRAEFFNACCGVAW